MAYRFDHYNSTTQSEPTEQERQEETVRQILEQFFGSEAGFVVCISLVTYFQCRKSQPPTSPLAIEELDIIHFDDDKSTGTTNNSLNSDLTLTLAKYKSETCPVCTDNYNKGQESSPVSTYFMMIVLFLG